MSCVLAVKVGISHIVQVVSILDVIINDGETVFQSRDVRGAVCSGVLELESKASGVSLLGGRSRVLFVGRVIELEVECIELSDGNDHSLRWSPDVAKRSVDCFCEDGGSQSKRVTGYECVASATFTKSRPYFGAEGVYDAGEQGVIWDSKI
jgi:hypothetical protein